MVCEHEYMNIASPPIIEFTTALITILEDFIQIP